MTPLAHYMPPVPAPFVPAGHGFPDALPARIAPMPGGGAWVTIGRIRYPHANAAAARSQLEAMAARGLVHLQPSPEAAPC
ncbi:MAG: hypothetical protein NDJ72_05205 [Elusimicrobia bacterium]|nr:hypothetical protein [Elusimicrobiota bacterium]